MSIRAEPRQVAMPPAGSEPSGRQRIVGFDVLRLLGAVAVVWIHACDTNALCFRLSDYAAFAVPGFLMMSAFLLQRSLLSRPSTAAHEILFRRLGRLLPAYLGWSAIYMVLRVARRLVAGRDDPVSSLVAVLGVGAASYQLYFVAALLYLTVLFLPAMEWVAGRKPHIGVYVGLALLSTVLWLAQRIFIAPLVLPVDYAMLKPMTGLVPYMPVGMMAAIWQWNRRDDREPGWWGVALCGSVVVLSQVLPIGGPGRSPLYAIGAFGVALCVPASIRLPRWVQLASALSFGVYLVHAVFVESLQRLAPAVGFDTGAFGVTVAIIVCSVLGSFAAAAALSALRWTRWLVV
jgi:peptidoglycan/LPS O-acetylase OafA/YrhL